MRNQIGSSVLAAAASLLVIGLVSVGTAAPASAASEEDLAAPPGSFVSTMPVPAEIAHVAYNAGEQPVGLVYSEEDLAAPQGSFVSTMPVPPEPGSHVRVASVSEDDVIDYDDLAQATLRQAVAAALE